MLDKESLSGFQCPWLTVTNNVMPYVLLEWHSGYKSCGGHVQLSLI